VRESPVPRGGLRSWKQGGKRYVLYSVRYLTPLAAAPDSCCRGVREEASFSLTATGVSSGESCHTSRSVVLLTLNRVGIFVSQIACTG
jgi:hypothetical protein